MAYNQYVILVHSVPTYTYLKIINTQEYVHIIYAHLTIYKYNKVKTIKHLILMSVERELMEEIHLSEVVEYLNNLYQLLNV